MSAQTPGNFDCALIQEVKRRSEDLFNPLSPNPDYVADVAPIQMIREIQTARFTDLEDPAKDNTVKIIFMDKCGVEAPTDCNIAETCDIDGVEAGTNCADYDLNICKRSPGFKLTELKYRQLGDTVSWEQEMALNLVAEKKVMDELLSEAVVSFLDANSGVNLNGSPYTVGGDGNTTIPAPAWNADLFPYFAVTRQRNKMPKMSLLLGGLMEQALVKIETESNTPEGQSAVRKTRLLGKVFSDMFVTESVLSRKAAFLVHPDVVGFAHKAYYKPYGAGKKRVAAGNEQVLSTVESDNLPGVFYDMIMQQSCVNGDTVWTGQLFFKGAIHLAPTRCNNSRTGILQFGCA